MRYHALATDYDGTLTSDDRLSAPVIEALKRLRTSGRRVIMVTGRRLGDLLADCSHPQLFDLIVAENGAIVYSPHAREETRLGAPPSVRLVRELRDRGVEPLEIGQVIVATHAPHRATVQDVIWELGLEAQVIGNRGAVMVLPAGINKATGLAHALRELGLSRHEVVGVGDAENDHSFLRECECAVAVANASPALKEAADHVTQGETGPGVVELIDELVADDLAGIDAPLSRHAIPLGQRTDGTEVRLAPYGHNALVAGPPGCGKSTVAAGIVERLVARDYQVCIIDPEGDYGTLRDVVPIGDRHRAPSVDEVLSVLRAPDMNLAINLLGIALDERPEYFAQLLPRLQAMRARTGRPHWLLVDEAHHVLPATWGPAASVLPLELRETVLVTVHPEHVVPAALKPVDVVLAIGQSPDRTLDGFAKATGRALPWSIDPVPPPGCATAWFIDGSGPPFAMIPVPGRTERIRHLRKYAEGDLRWHSFWFRGPHGDQNLKAQNLVAFCELAQGVDDVTWGYHLRRGDYSRWFRTAIRDEHLADDTALIEANEDLSSAQTRAMIRALVDARYTLPA